MLPKNGARLISGIGDYGGFTHFDLNRPDPLGSHANPHFGNTKWSDGVPWLKQDFDSQGWYTVRPSAGCKDHFIFRRWGQALDYVCHRSDGKVS